MTGSVQKESNKNTDIDIDWEDLYHRKQLS